jgi:2-oxoglutarate dehydrogenase E1 component
VLRRQALLLETDPLPLVVLTPKSLLRHALTASSPRALAEGRFQLVIDDDEALAQNAKVKRLVFCSGKVFVDLVSSEQRTSGFTSQTQGVSHGVALIRVEQLYPFPFDEVQQILDAYPKVREICWVQEEPENMGAWEFVRPLFEQLIDGRWPLRYIGRVRNSSPSEGSAAWHQANQRAIVAQTFEEKADTRDADRVLSKQV